MCGPRDGDRVRVMEITQQYIACDLAEDETLADYRKRCGKSRRRRLFR